MNILITGANGQLGTEMRRAAAKSAHHFIFTDVADLDITDLPSIQKEMSEKSVQAIVNCAAYTNVDKAESDMSTADRINAKAAENLAVAAKEADATLIHISTDYVFDGTSNIPYTETDDTNPTGAYGATKLAGEEAIEATGCKSIIIRTAWLYSAWGNNFVKTMRRIMAEREEVNVVFDQIGSPTFAGDLADAICHIIDSGQLDKTGLYHFTDEGVCSWYDFAMAIRSASGCPCRVNPIHTSEYPSKTARPHYSVLDKSKFKRTFGYTIPHWHTSLLKCVAQLNNQQA